VPPEARWIVRQANAKQPNIGQLIATLSFDSLVEPYPPHHYRTTTRLERFSPTLRRRLHSANALPSDLGLVAMITRQIHIFNSAFVSTDLDTLHQVRLPTLRRAFSSFCYSCTPVGRLAPAVNWCTLNALSITS
jgi:hypothetical protein